MYLQGPLSPVADEIDAFELPVTGMLPPELVGRYIRNGPNLDVVRYSPAEIARVWTLIGSGAPHRSAEMVAISVRKLYRWTVDPAAGTRRRHPIALRTTAG